MEGGINHKEREKFYKILTGRSNCNDCFARFVCGGECLVNSHYRFNSISNTDVVMCKLKQHLYKLSILFKVLVLKSNNFEVINNACIEKMNRFKESKNISDYLSMHPNEKYYDVKINRKFNKKEKV